MWGILTDHILYFTCKYSVLFFPSRVVVMAGDFICLGNIHKVNLRVAVLATGEGLCAFVRELTERCSQ